MAHTPLKKLIYGIPLLTILGMLLSFFPVQSVTASMAATLYVSTSVDALNKYKPTMKAVIAS